MGLKKKLEDDLKQALKDKDEVRKKTIRLALAAIQNAEIAKRDDLEDGEVLSVLSKEAKIRRESLEQFAKGGREDLVGQQELELEILKQYLPAQLSKEEIEARAREVVAEVGATSLSQMGDVMRVLMPQLKGKADGQLVSTVVKGILKETG
jgi:uncharacterized protein YqeY